MTISRKRRKTTRFRSRHVAVLVETEDSWGRDVIQGIADYGQQHGSWTLVIDPRDCDPANAVAPWSVRDLVAVHAVLAKRGKRTAEYRTRNDEYGRIIFAKMYPDYAGTSRLGRLGVSLDTEALQTAIDAATAAGGGRVYAPPGTYSTGTIQLRDNVTLYLEAGAVVLGSPRREDYRGEFVGKIGAFIVHPSLIYAEDAENVAIRGRGVIDENSDAFHERRPLGIRIESYG